MIDPTYTEVSVHDQCALVGLPLSSYYYRAKPCDPEEERLMALLDRHYTEHPFEGKIKRAKWLTAQVHYPVSKRRVKTLMEKMGLATVYPKPNTSVPRKDHEVYPYLLKELDIIRPNQVWATDITYIRLKGSHVYLIAIIDWYSRYVIEWSLSPTLEADFCVETLKTALLSSRCDIFNSDQGAQFTSKAWIDVLKEHSISISMDGRGRYLDNIFVERLWRSVKQECIYLREFESIDEVQLALEAYFEYYNHRRIHQALGYKTPAEVYTNKSR